MEEKIIRVRNRAKEIIGRKSIETLSNERELIEQINEIAKTDGSNIEYDIKALDSIERYLLVKEKMQFAEKDLEFLKNLSKSLKEQETRKSDNSNPPLFKISNATGIDVFFLTRQALKEYNQFNQKNSKKAIEIPSSNSEELAKLLEIIKRNF